MITNDGDLSDSEGLGASPFMRMQYMKRLQRARAMRHHRAPQQHAHGGWHGDLDGADDGLGFGFRSIGRGLKKVGSGAAKVGKAGLKVGMLPATAGLKVAKVVSKAAFNLAVKPIRWQLNKIKGGRAQAIAARGGHWKPTAADHAQARQDTKAYLASKGPHGKLLSYLAGPSEMGGAELGAAGVDDAAIIAASGMLTALASKLVKDAASSGFSKVAKYVPAGGTAAQAVTYAQQAVAPAAPATPAAEEVKTQAAEHAEKVKDEALESAGYLGEAESIVKVAANPAGMPKAVAEKVAKHSVTLVKSLSPRALMRIGGQQAADIGARLKSAVQQGRKDEIKQLLPMTTQIAAKAAAEVVDLTVPQGPSPSTRVGSTNMGGASEDELFATDTDDRTGYLVYTDRSPAAAAKRRAILTVNAKAWGIAKGRIPALAVTPARESTMNAAGLGLLASLAGADESALAAGLAGADLEGVTLGKAAMYAVPVVAVAALLYWKLKA
jgi:hypothetical protein